VPEGDLLVMELHEKVRGLKSYTNTQGKKAWENEERQFIVTSKYPMIRQRQADDYIPECEACAAGAVEIFFDLREDTGALVLKCAYCLRPVQGGYGRLGFRGGFSDKKDPLRIFKPHERMEILRRDRVRCFLCGATPESDELVADHIVPHASKGPTEILNGITLCVRCNTAKSDKGDPVLMLNALAHTHRDAAKGDGFEGLFSLVRSIGINLRMWKEREDVK